MRNRLTPLLAAPVAVSVTLVVIGCARHGTPASAAAASSTAAVQARVIADFAKGHVTLLGSLPDAATHERLLERAYALYGRNHVSDQISVDARVAPAEWLAGEKLLLPLVDDTIVDGQSAFDGKTLVITGRIPTETMKRQIVERTTGSAGAGISVLNELRVMQSR